jgi:hypothetical protein
MGLALITVTFNLGYYQTHSRRGGYPTSYTGSKTRPQWRSSFAKPSLWSQRAKSPAKSRFLTVAGCPNLNSPGDFVVKNKCTAMHGCANLYS